MLKFQSRALILTVSMLATLSGCSQESDPIQSPITITTTATTMLTTTVTTSAPNPVPPDAQLGDSVNLEVSRATVCIYGDGYGTTTWLAGTDTSCEFVVAVHQKLVTGVNATTEDIRDFLPMDINVTSPVTGQEYQMSCTNESAKVSACRSNTNASVYFY
ncbi:hypothetical protein P9K31_07875 [Corynebacterium glutamicum]|uniref:hypothetical protein n=1 Tax=Corynebacterium TaxID=1716 RepID=UPI0007200032|nr:MULTISPECIES: hypothetical protein [Corynebacterium]ALP50014.1 hypothetical protein AC079_07300 [Corynebacterium glutamicum]ANR62395.1 hypothetical protein C628_07210 [[Brevibacterium] flavum ZL-1]ANR65397.1 hypothetical protein C627_07140 [Corynebacterium glutamicum ZL-6]ANU33530.1 hypothetical protein BBD29_07090 [Corynebacterium glutamicum]APT07277.1 hypothetical protein BSP99_07290 [Corynebacterium glutamicum]